MMSLAALSLLATGCGAAASTSGTASNGTRIIRLSVDNPPGNGRAEVEQKFAQLVAKDSGGRLKVTIYYNGSLGGSEATAIQSLLAGGSEMAIVGTANFVSFDKQWNLFDLPFLFSGPAALYKYMASPEYEQLVNSTVQKVGLRYIFPYYDGWRQLVTTSTEVRALSQESGLKLRDTGSPVEIAYDRAFGAQPVSLAFNETYLGLKENLVDGLMIGYPDLVDFSMGDAVHYAVNLNVAPELVTAFIRENYFASLPYPLQQDLLAAGRATGLFAQAEASSENAAAITKLEGQGMKICYPSPSARQQWVQAAQPVYRQFQDVLSAQQKSAIQKLTS